MARNTLTPQRILFGTLIYLVIAFPLALVWHMDLFSEVYQQLGYISREQPGFVLGFLSLVVQGGVLATLYPLYCRDRYDPASGLQFGLLMGLFFWSSHVLAYAATHELASILLFMVIESPYLALQFGLSGLAIGWVYRDKWNDRRGYTRVRRRMASQATRYPQRVSANGA